MKACRSAVRAGIVTAMVAGAALLTGCGALRDIYIRDRNSPEVSARVTVRPEMLARNATSRGGIEIGHARFSASGAQRLYPGEQVALELPQDPVEGPDTLFGQAKVQQTHLAYSHRLSFGPHFQLEPALGVAHLRVRAQAQAQVSPQQARIHADHTGFLFGVTPRWRFNDAVALELRLVGINSQGLPFNGMADLGLVLNVTPQVGLKLGYSKRQLVVFRSPVSDLSISATGPSASLVFDF